MSDSDYEVYDDSEYDTEYAADIVPRILQTIRGLDMGGVQPVRRDSDRVIPPVLGPVTYYDQNLTPAHKYLGDRLHETTGRTIFEEGVIHTIPVIFLGINLIPGQILPIIARSENIKVLLKYVLARNRVFGVSYKYNVHTLTFGTIAEVFEHSLDSLESSQQFQVKAMGHQRYEILSIHQFTECQNRSLALAQIKIIPEIALTHPYNNLCLHTRKHNLNHSNTCRKRDMWQTQWPDWVYKQFDVNQLASRVAEKVKLLYKNVKVSDDPSILSLQVTRLGILSEEQVSNLLGMKSTNLRLQYELDFWNKNESLQKFWCARKICGTPLCNMGNVFPMSPEGPLATYCNTWGNVFDLITVTELDDIDVKTVGNPSDECCWFPGYKWIIILCPNCHNHLGWRYLAHENSSLMPRLFYGLSMHAITSTKK